MLFDVANHMMNGILYLPDLSEKERLNLALIMFKAGVKAQNSLAYSMASSYFKLAIGILDVSKQFAPYSDR